MNRRRTRRLAAVAGASALVVSAFAPGQAGAGSEGGWQVDTEDCPDPDATNAPIEGTIRIGSTMPLSGPVAAAFQPAALGLQAYIAYANENELVPGVTIELEVRDDQYDQSLTPGEVQGLIDDGVHMFAANIGTDQNNAVVDTINEECIPHLNLLTGDPSWGEDIEDHPWTTGLLTPYHHESRAYAENIAEQFPDQGVALYYTNNEFGNVYMDSFREAADEAGLEIVTEQTIEAGDTAPPQAQLSDIADSEAGVIAATPLGIQCLTFLNQLAEAKAANSGWEPQVYLTNTCASPAILGDLAAANGLFTSAPMGLIDIANPANAELEPVATYFQYGEAAGLEGPALITGGAGWNAGEVTVAVLIAAAESPEGLTQASIINAARSLNFIPSLLREGMNYIMNGEEDTYYSEDLQIVQYDSEAQHFTDVGEFYSYETSAGAEE
jgi:branched-chain amino acid transport system substrate-binding protein